MVNILINPDYEGNFRVVKIGDKWYVVGHGQKTPAKDEQDAYRILGLKLGEIKSDR